MSEVEEPRARGWRIVFRVDADPLIGGGHAMRCLTLADALAVEGADVQFVSAMMPDSLAARIASSGHRHTRIPAEEGLRRQGSDWHDPPLDAEAQRRDAAATAQAIQGTADWLVVDHYLLDAEWERAMRSAAGRIIVIDDLANRPHDCDLLLDQTLGRAAADYYSLVPADAKVLAGPQYALLRPEFARERPEALRRRAEALPPRRILVSLGTMDIGGISARAVEEALEAAPDCEVDVVLGQSAPSLERVTELAASDPRIMIHVGSSNVAELMRNADVAIGAAGTSSWERCCLGLPALVVALSGNQEMIARELASAGAHLLVKNAAVDQIALQLRQLLDDPNRLSSMAARASEVTDGRGYERVRALMTELVGEEV